MANEKDDDTPDNGEGEGEGVRPNPVPATPIPLVGTIVPTEPVMGMQQIQIWQGQFPPPDAIASYEKTMPGAFNRLMLMAERQQEASIEAYSEARQYLRDDTKRGHYLGALVVALAIIGAIICVWLSQPWVAVALVGVPVLAVAKALVDSTKTDKPALAVAVAPTHPVASDPPPSATETDS